MEPEEFGKIMEVKDLACVHLTKYFSKEQKIRTMNSNFPESTLRNTIHFAINHPVNDVIFYGGWSNAAYAIISPLEDLCKEPGNKIWNFNVVDTYFVGDTKLPKGSTVIITQDYQQVVDAGIINENTFFGLMDERNVRYLDDKLVVEKEGIRYLIYLPQFNDLRSLVRNELKFLGYENMPGGQWNWGHTGADRQDQERIAAQIGAECGVHCDKKPYFTEGFSHLIGNRCNDLIELMQKYLLLRKDGEIVSHIDDYDEDKQRVITKIEECFENLRKMIPALIEDKATLPEDYHLRIDRFAEAQKAKLRRAIPKELITHYQLPI